MTELWKGNESGIYALEDIFFICSFDLQLCNLNQIISK